MLFKNFKLKDGNHFVAMEYCWGILNRTFLVLITEDYLIGIQVNGVISATDGGIPEDVLLDPYYYIDEKYIYKIENEDILGTNIFLKNKTNFKINRKDIKNIIYDSKKKWGMAYYPHDGKVYIETMDGKKREFIILGDQSGEEIVNWIRG